MTEEYTKEHVCCPECGSSQLIETLIDCVGDKDLNKAECSCGWKGIVDDLIPDRMSAQRLREIHKNEVQADPSKPETWDSEMIADYFIWILGKKSTKEAESIMEMTIEKWRQ